MGALERGGDRFAGSRGMRMGRMLGFFESFPFFQIGRRPWAFVDSVGLTCVCVFQGDLSTPIRVSLIVVPDKSSLSRTLQEGKLEFVYLNVSF